VIAFFKRLQTRGPGGGEGLRPPLSSALVAEIRRETGPGIEPERVNSSVARCWRLDLDHYFAAFGPQLHGSMLRGALPMQSTAARMSIGCSR